MEPERNATSWPPERPARWSAMLPREIGAPRTARRLVDEWLRDAPGGVRDDARAVVSELVTNAVRYGRPPIHLRVERQARGWRIDVADSGYRRFGPRSGTPSGGWGLRVVDALADDWGVADDASRVWCRLHSPSSAQEPARHADVVAAIGTRTRG
jgi:anti-sigma regulatory factor (Ser/Thr protein kinase)